MTENNNTETIIDTIHHTTQHHDIDVKTNKSTIDIKKFIESLHIDIDALSTAIDAMVENRTPIKDIPKKHPNFIKIIIDFICGIFKSPDHKE